MKTLSDKLHETRQVAVALLEWIDAVPADTPLPSMPGVDRDWVDSVLHDDRKYTETPLTDAYKGTHETHRINGKTIYQLAEQLEQELTHRNDDYKKLAAHHNRECTCMEIY